MAALVPAPVEREIVARLFLDAQAIGWETAGATERSRKYREWLDSPEVGGVLVSFMTIDQARLWIKDGPMKEYARALNGVGKHADLILSKNPDVSLIIRRAMGEGWEPEVESIRVKPLRVTVRQSDGDKSVVFSWGPSRDFKHLIWASLRALSDSSELDWVLCVVAPFVNPTPANLRVQHERIAARCGVRVFHVSV